MRPAALAFARAVSQRPDVNFYDAHKQPPSPFGTYLAACTAYASLFGRSPVGLAHTADLDPSIATFLQRIAWQTVQEYLTK